LREYVRSRTGKLKAKTAANASDPYMVGMMATCIQHEMHHLEGILSIDHLSRLKRQMALKKLEKPRKAA
jgi:peptide deformylase